MSSFQDPGMSVLFRTDMSSRLPQVIGVFDNDQAAIASMSYDLVDHARKFLSGVIDTSVPLCASLSDGSQTMFLWVIVHRFINEPRFIQSNEDIQGSSFINRPDNVF